MHSYSTFFQRKITKSFRTTIILLLTVMLIVISVLEAKLFMSEVSLLQEQSVSSVEEWFDEQMGMVNTMSSYLEVHPELLDDYDTFQGYLEKASENYSNLLAAYVGSPSIPTKMICSDGWIPEEDYDVVSREWYAKAKEADGIAMTEPYVDATYGILCVSISKPVKGTDAVFAIDLDLTTLQEALNGYCDGKRSVSLISAEDTIVTSPKEEYALSEEVCVNMNDTEYAKANESGKIIGVSYGKMVPVACGYKLYVSERMLKIIFVFLTLIVLYILILLGILAKTKKNIVSVVEEGLKPFENIKEKIMQIANCDMCVEFTEQTDIKDIYELQTALHGMAENIRMYIGDIDKVLRQLSENNLSTQTSMEYLGDFATIKGSMDNITGKFRRMISEIGDVSDVVTKSADELSEAAGKMAENSNEQTNSMNNLKQMFEDFLFEMKKIQSNMSEANEAIKKSSVTLSQISTEGMGKLTSSMENISNSSDKISDFVTRIDEISSQTNLLSLNASIEAARAGEAGRGFAVVAEEIGKLSNDTISANAEISGIIEDNISFVEDGKTITAETKRIMADSIKENEIMVASIGNVNELLSELIAKIEDINSELAVSVGREKSNLQLTEECYARTEELLSSSEILDENIRKYKV